MSTDKIIPALQHFHDYCINLGHDWRLRGSIRWTNQFGWIDCACLV